MAVSLVKGGNVSLTKTAPTMTKTLAGLGWDTRATDGQDFDLDCSVFMVDESNKVLSDANFIFFNNKVSPCGSVTHNGDNLTGEGDWSSDVCSSDLVKVKVMMSQFLLILIKYQQKLKSLFSL